MERGGGTDESNVSRVSRNSGGSQRGRSGGRSRVYVTRRRVDAECRRLRDKCNPVKCRTKCRSRVVSTGLLE